MSDVLSQDEVDALLRGIGGGEIEVESDIPSKQGGVQSYDFANQDRIIRGRMPTLDIVHDRFARNFRKAISSTLRRSVDISVASSEMAKFGDFVRGLPLPTSLHLFRMNPLRGYGLLVLEGKLVFAFVDAFFGGSGAGHVKLEGRDFTVIEQRLIRKVVDTALAEYQEAWSSVEGIVISHSRSEINPQFVNIVPPSDVVVQIKLEMEFDDTNGYLSFCLPYSLLEPIKKKLRQGYQGEAVAYDAQWGNRLQKQLGECTVDLSVVLGSSEITGHELLQLKEGDVITLQQDSEQPVDIMVEEIPKYQGRIGVHKGMRAVQVENKVKRNY